MRLFEEHESQPKITSGSYGSGERCINYVVTKGRVSILDLASKIRNKLFNDLQYCDYYWITTGLSPSTTRRKEMTSKFILMCSHQTKYSNMGQEK